MTCDKCGSEICVIFLTAKHEKICDVCWDKINKKSEWEIIKEKNERYKHRQNSQRSGKDK